MYTSEQCIYLTYYDPKLVDNLSSGFVTYIMGYSSKSRGEGEGRGKTSGITDDKDRNTGTHG